MELIKQAEKVYFEHFDKKTCFERAIFFSWYCGIRDCTFCYMSTQPDDPRYKTVARRTFASLAAEVLLCKKLGWRLGFLSGGIDAHTIKDFVALVKILYKVYGDKFWVNAGPLPRSVLEELKPYIIGVVGSIETVNLEIHKEVCPSKPTAPYERMFMLSHELGLENAMTIILGLGETFDDFDALKEWIITYHITKIHFYGLNPQKGTVFEGKESPSAAYQAEWIARTRLAFPTLDIQMGIWKDRVERVSTLLKAGANSISKFPATKMFGSKLAFAIEEQAALAGREFQGTLTKLPDLNWDKEVDKLDLDSELKVQIKEKLKKYLNKMASSQGQ